MDHDLLTELLKAIGAIAAAVLTPILTRAALALARRLRLEVSAAEEARVRAIVQSAIAFVEEYAATRLKAGKPVTSGEKLRLALEQIAMRAPEVPLDRAAVLVHEELPHLGVGATAGPRPAPAQP